MDSSDELDDRFQAEEEIGTEICGMKHRGSHKRKRQTLYHHFCIKHENESPTRTSISLLDQIDGASELGRRRFGAMYPVWVGFSVTVYWTFVSLIPVYNKSVFQKSLFPYPIATAAIQLGVVSIFCGVVNVFQHRVFSVGTESDSQQKHIHVPNVSMETHERSWILGPHFLWKLKWCLPIGALFGIKYGVSNLGLHLVSAPTHVLLQSTDLVWTIIGAWSINGERLSMVEIVSLIGCIAGSLLLSWSVLSETHTDRVPVFREPLFAIAINLTSPILLGLCLSTLRLACIELMRPDNRVNGSVSAIELTSIKLSISSIVGLVMAVILERGAEEDANGSLIDPWWVAFMNLSSLKRVRVICGAFLVSIFQVNCTFLTFLTSTVALGIVGQVKIIPQWIIASIVGIGVGNKPTGPMGISGGIVIMVSAACFAISSLIRNDKVISHKPSIREERTDVRKRAESMSPPTETTRLLS